MVADLKSQKSMDFGGLKIAIQLAIYAHAYAVWNEDTETWEDPPPIDQEEAAVLWAPIGHGACEPFRVNLVRGWHWAQRSLEAREGRKENLVVPWGVQAPTKEEMAADLFLARWQEMLEASTTADELVAIGAEAAKAYGGQLPDQLKVLGRELREKLATKAS